MVPDDAGSESRLAVPFLSKPRAERQERTLAIFTAVKDYLDKIAAALPYYKMQGVLPQGTPMPNIPDKPSCLEALDKRERWGFPNPGTWLDQPLEYMEDLDAADAAKTRFRIEQEQKAEQETIATQMMNMADLPKVVG